MIKLFDTYTLPTWAVYALTYSDESGLNDDELLLLAKFEEKLPKPYTIEPIGDEFFSHYNSVDNLASTCQEVNIWSHKQ